MIHFASQAFQIGPHIRQRCVWCALLLEDYDLRRMAFPEGQDPTPATWVAGSLVEVDGDVQTSVEHTPGVDPLPPGTCYELDNPRVPA